MTDDEQDPGAEERAMDALAAREAAVRRVRAATAVALAAVPVAGVNLFGAVACGSVSESDVDCVTALLFLVWPLMLLLGGVLAAQLVSGFRGAATVALGGAVGAATWVLFGSAVGEVVQLLVFMVLPSLLIGYVAGRGLARVVRLFRARPPVEDDEVAVRR